MLKIIPCLLLLALLIGCSSHLTVIPVDSKPLLPTTVPDGALVLSPQNTRITYVGTALTATHEGTFTRFTGLVECPDSLPEHAHIFAEIDMNSVYTEIPLLTKHLKDADFFDSEKYPRADFYSTAVSANTITGNLTLHGIKKSISFPAHFEIEPTHIAVTATIIIHQSDFAMQSARTTNNDVPVTVLMQVSR